MVPNQLGGFFKLGRPLPLEIREKIVDLYNVGYFTTVLSRRSVSNVVHNFQQYRTAGHVGLGLSQETERLKGKAKLSKPLERVYLVLPFSFLIRLDL